MTPRELRNRRLLTVGMAIAVLVASVGFGVLNAVAAGGDPLHVDTAWMAVVHPESSPWVAPSLFLHDLGAGLPAFVTVSATTGALLLWRRPWGAGCLLVAAIASTALIEIIKNSIGRPRPTLALIDVGFGSFPSGHSARAAMFAVALGILFPHLWVWMLGAAYTLAMMFSRTQLGAHWLTDTIGGALIGAAVALLCCTLVSSQLETEGEQAHPRPWGR
ncbi:MAG TPA: phosphatase PAP2 family protein [Homoserinimonas sp.]|nr:phosphatase PAP2 family protein [Homoserinimonas sp.]